MIKVIWQKVGPFFCAHSLIYNIYIYFYYKIYILYIIIINIINILLFVYFVLKFIHPQVLS